MAIESRSSKKTLQQSCSSALLWRISVQLRNVSATSVVYDRCRVLQKSALSMHPLVPHGLYDPCTDMLVITLQLPSFPCLSLRICQSFPSTLEVSRVQIAAKSDTFQGGPKGHLSWGRQEKPIAAPDIKLFGKCDVACLLSSTFFCKTKHVLSMPRSKVLLPTVLSALSHLLLVSLALAVQRSFPLQSSCQDTTMSSPWSKCPTRPLPQRHHLSATVPKRLLSPRQSHS